MSTLRWSPAHHVHSLNGNTPTAGVALAIHGLNYHPQRMQPVVDCLNAAGHDCLTISLHGHGDNFLPLPDMDEDAARLCSFTRVTYKLWADEVAAAYTVARARADEHGVPLLMTAYSLGALVACALTATRPDVRFDRLLLFAPALALPPRGLLPWLAERAPRSVLPSFSPRHYRANRGTPGAAYAAAYAAINSLNNSNLQRLNVPALVFIARRDEIVSCTGVEALSEQLSAWTSIRVHKTDGTNGRVYHHLVIGEEAVGIDAWRDMTAQITRFVVERHEMFAE